jgi:hypothetical protein
VPELLDQREVHERTGKALIQIDLLITMNNPIEKILDDLCKIQIVSGLQDFYVERVRAKKQPTMQTGSSLDQKSRRWSRRSYTSSTPTPRSATSRRPS